MSGHTGLLGRAVLRVLQRSGYINIVTKTSKELDLRNQRAVHDFFSNERPEYVFHLAARVGGMQANISRPAEFAYDNLSMQNNVLHEARLSGVSRLIFTGSNCMYPRLCPQPMKEEHLFTGVPEPTNEAYAVAKLAGFTMCQSYNKQYGTNFVVAISASFYGPNDHFGADHSHMIPELILLLHNAKKKRDPNVSFAIHPGKLREFIYVDDVARACLFLMKISDRKLIDGVHVFNIGTGKSTGVGELAELIKNIIGYNGRINWDSGASLGMPKKVLDIGKISKSGWTPGTTLEDGLLATYQWFLENEVEIAASA